MNNETKIKDLHEPLSSFNDSIKAITQIWDRVIYLQPHIYKIIVGLGLAVPNEPKNDNDLYIVYTKYPHDTDKGLKEIAVTKEVGEAIKILIKDKPQFMFPSIDRAPFDSKNSVLTIDRISFDIPRDTARFQLCKVLFGNKKNIGRKWNTEEIAERLDIKDVDTDKKYHFIYDQVKSLNKDIQKFTTLQNFVICKDKLVLVDPVYSHTFLR